MSYLKFLKKKLNFQVKFLKNAKILKSSGNWTLSSIFLHLYPFSFIPSSRPLSSIASLSISSVNIHFHPSPPIFCIFTLAADPKLHFVGPLSWLYVLWMTSTWNATTEVTWGRLHHLWVQCANCSTLHHVAFCLTHTVCCLLNIGWFSEDPGEALESWSTSRVSKAWYSIPGWWGNWGLSLAGWKSKTHRNSLWSREWIIKSVVFQLFFGIKH